MSAIVSAFQTALQTRWDDEIRQKRAVFVRN